MNPPTRAFWCRDQIACREKTLGWRSPLNNALVFSRLDVPRKRIEHCQKLSVCLKTEQSLSKLIDGQRWVGSRTAREPE